MCRRSPSAAAAAVVAVVEPMMMMVVAAVSRLAQSAPFAASCRLRHVTLEEGSGPQALHTITDRGRSEQPHLQSTGGYLKYDGGKHHHLVFYRINLDNP